MKKLFTLVATFVLFSLSAFGQATSGVTGVVTDPTGALVPGVKVTLIDTKTSAELTTTTNDNGSYTFNNVLPGEGYRLTFAGQGFQTYSLSNVTLGIGRTETQNVQLTAGQVTETIEVTSTSGDATLNTTDASIGNVIGSRQLRELPIQIRGTPAALIGLQPGAIGTNVATGAIGGNRTGSVTGARPDQGNVTVDGVDVNDQAGNFAFSTVANAPIDSIQEFRAVTSGPNASSGRSSGGQTELTTKSGTNDFHGSLREYWRHERFAANSFFNNRNKVARPALRRHQYGGSIGGPLPFFNFGEGGPMFNSGKDRLFFFFDFEGRRDRSQQSNSRTVPLQSFRDGRIAYVNTTAGCTASSRVETAPQCISYLTPAQIQQLDPAGIGANQALLSFFNSRFPLPNDLTGGDGRNTGLFRWNAPNVRDDAIFTTRIDSNISDSQRIFARHTYTIRDSTNALQYLPQDADAVTFKDRSFVIAGGHNWVINSAWANSITLGLTKQANFFSPPDIEAEPYSWTFGTLANPFPSLSYQDRNVYVPTIRDDVTWTTGQHTLQFGVSLKPILQNATLTNDYNFVTVGLGGLTTALNSSLRPSNIRSDAVASYDSAFTFLLGRIGALSTNYNLQTTGAALPPGSGKIRSYAYNEYEWYVQDNWKIRNDLTINLGVRHHLYPAPYERDGLQADHNVDFEQLFATRVANAAAGIATNSSEPFLSYNLSGKVNNGAPFYETTWLNFAPRIGFAYNPSFKGGALGALFGERKTVLRGNWSMVYDRVAGAITFIQNQLDYLFASNVAFPSIGNTNPAIALANDPRFVSISSLPIATTPPSGARPVTPFVTNGAGTGLSSGSFNYTIDKEFRIPKSYTFNFGMQRELPGNMILDVSYVGRMGRDLFVQSDVSQVLNFRDNASGQFLFDALNAIQPLVAANVAAGVRPQTNVPAQPWLENQMTAAIAALRGPQFNCTNLLSAASGPIANCAQFVAAFQPTLTRRGGTADLIRSLNQNRLLFNNVGMSSQFATNAYISNQGSSDYHGGLLSLQKRFSQGFEFELNYTYSKSLDNNSSVVNTVSGGLVCDVADPDICRGFSDFDIRHVFNANFIWDLPFGRRGYIGKGVNKWVDAIIGGWTLSGIASARSGFAINSSSGAFPIGFNLASAGIVTGDASAFEIDIRDTPAGIQFFRDPVAAQAALRYPRHGEMGSRNTFRSPNFWGVDMGLAKKIDMPWNETHRLTLRMDAFNVTNTNAFSTPVITLESSSFGLITGSLSNPREIQFAIRYDF